eukprot:Em0008g797a
MLSVAMFGAPKMPKLFADSWDSTAALQQLCHNLVQPQQIICGQEKQVDVLVLNQGFSPVLHILLLSLVLLPIQQQ